MDTFHVLTVKVLKSDSERLITLSSLYLTIITLVTASANASTLIITVYSLFPAVWEPWDSP